jgi:hypothetical protein
VKITITLSAPTIVGKDLNGNPIFSKEDRKTVKAFILLITELLKMKTAGDNDVINGEVESVYVPKAANSTNLWLGKFKKEERYKLNRRDNILYLEENLEKRHLTKLVSNKGEFFLTLNHDVKKIFNLKKIPLKSVTQDELRQMASLIKDLSGFNTSLEVLT